MSMKEILEREGLYISDEEVMRRMQEAMMAGQEELVFSAGAHTVKMRLSHTAPQGCMRDYEGYY